MDYRVYTFTFLTNPTWLIYYCLSKNIRRSNNLLIIKGVIKIDSSLRYYTYSYLIKIDKKKRTKVLNTLCEKHMAE